MSQSLKKIIAFLELSAGNQRTAVMLSILLKSEMSENMSCLKLENNNILFYLILCYVLNRVRFIIPFFLSQEKQTSPQMGYVIFVNLNLS